MAALSRRCVNDWLGNGLADTFLTSQEMCRGSTTATMPLAGLGVRRRGQELGGAFKGRS